MEGWTEQAVYYKETKGKTLIFFDPEISENLYIFETYFQQAMQFSESLHSKFWF